MPSLTEIANLALAMVGEERVTRLDTDTSKPARLCNEMLPQVRARCLSEHPWNFAVRRASLPALASSPSWGYAYAYQVPADCIRVLEIDGADPHEPWSREGTAILTDLTAPLSIRYIADVTDPARWSPMFVDMVAATLAERLALPLSASQSSRAAIAQLLADIRGRARAIDAAEGTPHPATALADVLVWSRA